MNIQYRFETFSTDASEFDRKFGDFLNEMSQQGWHHKECFFCHGAEPRSANYASCTFTKMV